ncbi:MAG: hypothetical protein U0V74_09945 [Chitinophagales bacterium]
MKKKKSSPIKLAAEVAVVTAYGLSTACLERLKKQKRVTPLNDEKFQRKMTVLAAIYHFIGIFYNE